MLLICECTSEVRIEEAPTFGASDRQLVVECSCGRAYDARLEHIGELVPVCEGFQPPPKLRVLRGRML
jgi:hypothetical protein